MIMLRIIVMIIIVLRIIKIMILLLRMRLRPRNALYTIIATKITDATDKNDNSNDCYDPEPNDSRRSKGNQVDPHLNPPPPHFPLFSPTPLSSLTHKLKK